MRIRILIGLFGALVATSASGQPPSVAPGELECLPLEDNGALAATVRQQPGGSSVRLYFRRLNPVGAFYYDQMIASGNGQYWSVFPKPEDREQNQLTDEWWEILKDRDWMKGRDRDWLEDWLQDQENEAAEYFVAVHDAAGARLSRSAMRLVEVREEQDCPTSLTAQEHGWSENLTVGETTEIQAGKQVFHWLCDGIVTRVDTQGVLRADEFCRACVVALLPRVSPAAAVAAGIVSVSIIEEKASPTQPPP